MSTVGLLLISTNKYREFVQPLIDSVSENFLNDHQITIHLFTDSLTGKAPKNIILKRYLIPSYGFPQASLYRYKIFDSHSVHLTDNHLIYCDVDMRMVASVSRVILSKGLTAVMHPGFFKSQGWGSPSCDPRSTAFLPENLRTSYYAGGFQGGARLEYLSCCKTLSKNISKDESLGIIAEHNDETHWNYYLNSGEYKGELKVLDPSYCMVENMRQRKQWKIDDISPRIIALDKNHKQIRS